MGDYLNPEFRWDPKAILLGVFIAIILLCFFCGTPTHQPCSETRRADSLQALLLQCADCCNQMNLQSVQSLKWRADRDSILWHHFNSIKTRSEIYYEHKQKAIYEGIFDSILSELKGSAHQPPDRIREMQNDCR